MCKRILVACLVCLCATVVLAQGKVENGWACGKPAMANTIEVGDKANHAYAIDQIKCTSTKGEIAGVKEREGTGTEFAEVTGNNSKGHAVWVEIMDNGDKIYATYQPTITLKDGQMQSGSDQWQYTGGTGKFKGIKGSGTCTGKGGADGTSDWTCAGTYTIPK